MLNKSQLKCVNEILEITREFNWTIHSIFIEDNCIFGNVEKLSGIVDVEGLYAASDFDDKDVYIVFDYLKEMIVL